MAKIEMSRKKQYENQVTNVALDHVPFILLACCCRTLVLQTQSHRYAVTACCVVVAEGAISRGFL